MMPDNEYLGSITLFAGPYPPQNWMFCDGRELEITKYQALFALLRFNFGGDEHSTFALPDLRGRAVMGELPHLLWRKAGNEKEYLQQSHAANHTHDVYCNSNAGNRDTPFGNFFATSSDDEQKCYSSNCNATMNDSMVQDESGTNAHENVQPFIALNFIICVNGEYPHQLDS